MIVDNESGDLPEKKSSIDWKKELKLISEGIWDRRNSSGVLGEKGKALCADGLEEKKASTEVIS